MMDSLQAHFPSGACEIIEADGHCSGFEEQGVYWLIPGSEAASLFVDDYPLERGIHNGRHAWRWQPGFYSGVVLAECVASSGRTLAQYWLEVSPASHKAGDEPFRQMRDDLLQFDPELLIGTEPGLQGIGNEGSVGNLYIEYGRLRRFGPGVLRALSEVTRLPLARSRQGRRMCQPREARRLDATTIRRLAKTAYGARLLRREAAAVDVSADVTIDVPWRYEELDNPANRTLLAMLVAVRRRAARLLDLLRRTSEASDPTRTAVVPRLPRRILFLREMLESLRRIEQQPPFCSVSRTEISSAGLNAVAAHPLYASAYGQAWRLLRPGIAGADHHEMMWSSPTWQVYERWCFVALVKAIERLRPGIRWKRSYPATAIDQVCFEGTRGAGERLALWLQRIFPAWDIAKGDVRSLSRQRQPDIVLQWEASGEVGWIVFDAKYRTTRESVLEAMQSAHIYRDSLRLRGDAPHAAVLLVPRGGGAPWLESKDFISGHGVGVLELREAAHVDQLASWLDRALSSS